MAIPLHIPRLNEGIPSAAFWEHPAPQTFPTQPMSQLQAQVTLLFVLLHRMASQPDLIGHGDRTAKYAAQLGAAVGFSPDELIHLHYAALLHDIGKLTLPDTILNKSGSLTADEYALVQSHPRAGAELLDPISFLQVPAVWIAHHHERWDGSGYPYGLRGPFIPLGSRILAVADTFDALTSNQSYSRARDPESALRLLYAVAGSQLDPELVEVFVRLVPEPATIRPHGPIGITGWSPSSGRAVPPP